MHTKEDTEECRRGLHFPCIYKLSSILFLYNCVTSL